MATNTYVALATQTLGTATNSVTFSSIPSGYTDLVLVINGSVNVAAACYIQLGNGSIDTGTNYSFTYLYGSGSSAISGRESNVANIFASDFTTSQSTAIVNIQNYKNTSTYKTILCRGASTAATTAQVGLWRSTSAIDTIKVYADASRTFAAGSTFAVYGVAAASVGAKATGGTIYQDASYFYHVFSSSGTFTPSQSISADILCVAGGGGAANNIGGGGGAGGLLGFTAQSLTATGYTVTVGSGGTGYSGTGTQANGTAGGDSQFGALTLVKGGGYGAVGDTNGGTGGSGGGTRGITGIGGSATSGQGYAGQNSPTSNISSGGGGGAGAAGSTGNGSAAGNGGVGLSTYSSWGLVTGVGHNVSGTYYFAGGGGGGGYAASSITAGSGGYGGGGAGLATVDSINTNNGLASTGGGGGGGGPVSSGTSKGANGGSGVVIVRYAK